jgi:rhodanese-related sulfurtransferase
MMAALFQRLSGPSRRYSVAVLADVQAALKSGSTQLLDVRTPAEYEGVDTRGNRFGGHLPGAILLPHTQVQGAADPAAVFEAAGLKPDVPVITYCQSGMRAGIVATALEAAGFKNVSPPARRGDRTHRFSGERSSPRARCALHPSLPPTAGGRVQGVHGRVQQHSRPAARDGAGAQVSSAPSARLGGASRRPPAPGNHTRVRRSRRY